MSSLLQKSTNCDVYHHSPISTGQIRVISLIPNTNVNAPLKVQLEAVHLDDEPIYEALSYVWGVEQSTELLEISLRRDQSPKLNLDQSLDVIPTATFYVSSLSITRNLEVALRYLRLDRQPRRLWIDAICIDQTSTQERNEQVQQMHRVYSEAARVTVWLGEASQDSHIVFDIFDDLGKGPTAFQHVSSMPNSIPQAVDNLFARPWWSRRWVTQEVLLAKRDPLILCGHRSTSLENVTSFIHSYGYVFDWGLAVSYRLELRMREHAKTLVTKDTASRDELEWKDRNLMDLYADAGRQYATNPRDHVYAFLGLTTAWYRENIKVDYNLTASQVFQQATFAVIRQSRSLGFLLDLYHTSTSTIPNLPSWCTDFSVVRDGPLMLRTPNSVCRIIEWSIDTSLSSPKIHPGDFGHDVDLGILSVRGVILDELQNVYRTTTKKQDLLFRTKTARLTEALDTFYKRLGVEACQLVQLLSAATETRTTPNRKSDSCFKLKSRDLCKMLVAGNPSYGVHDRPYDFDLVADILLDFTQIGTRDDGSNQSRHDLLSTITATQKEMLLAYLKDAVLCAYWGSSYFSCTDGSRKSRSKDGDHVANRGQPAPEPQDTSDSVGQPLYLGIASRAISPNDVVVSLPEIRLPAILRPTRHAKRPAKKCWTLVSFAYITAGSGKQVDDTRRAEEVTFNLI